MRDEARHSRQDSRKFWEEVLQELTNLADRAESSPRSLETTIAMTLDRQSTEMNQLKNDLQFTHSQYADEVVAKLKAMVGFI